VVDAGRVADGIELALRSAGDPARAEKERRYLRSELDHVGASVPATRRIAKAVLADRPALGREELLSVVDELWSRRLHECRLAAVELLDLSSRVLTADDLELVERLIRESRTWALVDPLAVNVAGSLVARFPELGEALDRWARDGDFWVRRAALLAPLQELRRGAGDFDRFARYADAMLEEREFFVRKAIGWVLRETARKQPERVYAWLEPRAGRASGVTVREAVKYLSDEQRDAVLRRYRAAR
jgi:3-methyladenine DNA glycosylase AlkD